MTWQQIKGAEVDLDKASETYMKILVKNEMGVSSALTRIQIYELATRLKFNRPVKTIGQKRIFARRILHERMDMKNLNGPAKLSLEETAKEAREMAKEKHVEWKYEGLNKEITPAKVNKYLEDVQDMIIRGHVKKDEGEKKDPYPAIAGIGTSFKTFKQGMRGEGEDKYSELTFMATVDKDFALSAKLLPMVNLVVDLIAIKFPELKFDKWESKE